MKKRIQVSEMYFVMFRNEYHAEVAFAGWLALTSNIRHQ